MPKFSILIANYNNGKYLLEAVRSVQQQTCTDWEIVIVDDGSTDSSVDIYPTLSADERIRIFYNEGNKGCGYTKNRCVAEARGEWCGFLDPDDKLRSDALAVIAEYIERNPRYGVFFSHMYVCDENMNIVFDNTFPVNSPQWNTFIHYQRGIHLYCFNKGVYLSTTGIHLSLPQSVDIDLYYKMSEVTEIYYIDLPLYYYRNNPVSLTKNPIRATSTHLWVMLESLRRQNVSETEMWKEIEGFWRWRTEPLCQEIETIKKDRYYLFGQKVRTIKTRIKAFFK